jgi:general secretion pathway protein D
MKMIYQAEPLFTSVMLSRLRKLLSASLPLCFVMAADPAFAWAGAEKRFAFENADISVIVDEVARLTGTTFLFDPARVKGRITVLAPGDVSPAQALELLRSALTLHGYALVARPEGTWIVPSDEVAGVGIVVRVVPLNYASADELAFPLSWVAPPGVRIVPYYPTNNVVLSGRAAAVEQLIDIIHGR